MGNRCMIQYLFIKTNQIRALRSIKKDRDENEKMRCITCRTVCNKLLEYFGLNSTELESFYLNDYDRKYSSFGTKLGQRRNLYKRRIVKLKNQSKILQRKMGKIDCLKPTPDHTWREFFFFSSY